MQVTESWKKLAEYSRNALQDGDLERALNYALEAFPEGDSVLQPAQVPEAQAALTDALGVYDLSDGYKVHGTLELPSAPLYLAVSPDSTTVSCVCESSLSVFDTESRSLLAALPTADSALSEAAYLDADTLLYAGEDGISCYEIGNERIRWSGEPATGIAVSADGKRAAGVYKDESHVSIYDTEDGTFLKQIDLNGRHQSVAVNDVFANPNDNLLALNEDGSLLAVSMSDGSLEIFDLGEGGRGRILLDGTSGYTHFEGGFYEQYFAFSASSTEESVFVVIDTETMEQTGGFQSAARFSVLADEEGICVQTENLFVQIDPVTGEQKPLVTTGENILAYARDDENALIATEGAFSFYGPGAVELAVFEKEDETDFTRLKGGLAVLGSRNSPILRLLKYENHSEAEVFAYDLSISHDEARISADGSSQFLFIDSCVFQDLAGRAVHGEQGPDNRFERHKFIPALGRIVLRPCQHFVAFAAQVRFSALHFRERCDLAFQDLFNLSAVDTQLLEQEVRDIFPHFEDSGQQVLRFDGLLSSCLHEVHSLLDGFLSLDGKFVKCHGCSPLFIMIYSPNSLCGFKADIQEASKNLPFRAD